MKYHIDGKQLPSWARGKIDPDAIKTRADILAGFYCNLVYTFIENNYVGGGLIRTSKTRNGIREYLTRKKNPTKINGSLCKTYFADLLTCGLAKMDEDKVEIVVPETLINKGQVSSVTRAIEAVTSFGWRNFTASVCEQAGITLEDIVEACYAINQLLPEDKRSTKDHIKIQVEKQMKKNQEECEL